MGHHLTQIQEVCAELERARRLCYYRSRGPNPEYRERGPHLHDVFVALMFLPGRTLSANTRTFEMSKAAVGAAGHGSKVNWLCKGSLVVFIRLSSVTLASSRTHCHRGSYQRHLWNCNVGF